jgi:hypothetical protein
MVAIAPGRKPEIPGGAAILTTVSPAVSSVLKFTDKAGSVLSVDFQERVLA